MKIVKVCLLAAVLSIICACNSEVDGEGLRVPYSADNMVDIENKTA